MNEAWIWQCLERLRHVARAGQMVSIRAVAITAKKWLTPALACFMAITVSAGSADDPVAAAVDDLAARVGAEVHGIEVVSEEEVTWPDGSAGCPKPGMMYAQVLTNGSRLILAFDGNRYHYHSRKGEAYFYCANPSSASSQDI